MISESSELWPIASQCAIIFKDPEPGTENSLTQAESLPIGLACGFSQAECPQCHHKTRNSLTRKWPHQAQMFHLTEGLGATLKLRVACDMKPTDLVSLTAVPSWAAGEQMGAGMQFGSCQDLYCPGLVIHPLHQERSPYTWLVGPCWFVPVNSFVYWCQFFSFLHWNRQMVMMENCMDHSPWIEDLAGLV